MSSQAFKRGGANLYERRKQAWRAAVIADKEEWAGKGSATLRTSEPPAVGRRHIIKDTSNGPRAAMPVRRLPRASEALERSPPQSSRHPRQEQERADLQHSKDRLRPRKTSDLLPSQVDGICRDSGSQESRHGDGRRQAQDNAKSAASTQVAQHRSKSSQDLFEEELAEEDADRFAISSASSFSSAFCQTQREPRAFNCLLKCDDLPAARGRDVLVCLELEESDEQLQGAGHKPVLIVRCALHVSILLELQADLLRYREDAAKIQVAFNARNEDIEWWVLEFVDCQEMRRFREHLLRLAHQELEWAAADSS